MSKKNTKTARPSGILSGVNFNLKKINRKNRRILDNS